ncbi:DUF4446 family protein [bacterium]|nr:DUF4446 family protein [bacterium]
MLFGKKKDNKKISTIEEAADYIQKLEKKLDESNARIRELEDKSKLFFEKFEIVRYNPFNEVGGDQSFSLGILNSNHDGFIFTSIYNKEGNRLYAKPVAKGESKYQLSEEENIILKKMINK